MNTDPKVVRFIPGSGLSYLGDDGKETPVEAGQNNSAANLVYTAILSQSGTAAPVATELENTVGEITWHRTSAGLYAGRLPTAYQQYPLNRIFVIYRYLANVECSPVIVLAEDFSSSWAEIYLGSNGSDDVIADFPVEIRIYPLTGG